MCDNNNIFEHWDAEKFKEWLLSRGFSENLSIDCISRCRRVEKILQVNLVMHTKTEQLYIGLMLGIKDFAEGNMHSKKSAMNLTSSLRRATRCLALFLWQSKAEKYPKHYRFYK